MSNGKIIDLYLDAEWYLNRRLFLIGYSHDHKNCKQIFGSKLTKKNFRRILKRVIGSILCYGPDIGMLEKFFGFRFRKKFRCVNLMKVFKDFIKIGNFKLKHLGEGLGIKRKVMKYKTSVGKIGKTSLEKEGASYNQEDVIGRTLEYGQYK